MKKENWKKEFDKFHLNDYISFFYDGEERFWDFIEKLLRQEKEKLLERIKLKKKGDKKVQKAAEILGGMVAGYNLAVDDLEKLKNQLKDEK
jgi:hypothetical protein